MPWTVDLNGEEIVGTFQSKEKQKRNKIEFRSQKVIKREGEKLYIKWKGCDNSFSSYIDKKISLYKVRYYPELLKTIRNYSYRFQ